MERKRVGWLRVERLLTLLNDNRAIGTSGCHRGE